MSLHVDLFVCFLEGKLAKQVYFTGIYRCDQAMTDTLAIADAVLDEMTKDFPKVKEIYAKSDNAGCYHANYAAECIRELCSDKGITLKRYDYNEPCCGKDDCDRVSAGAKCVVKSYVNAGNDLVNAADLHKALQYGKGVQNGKCGIIEIDSKKSEVKDAACTLNISNYHSILFKENEMVFWRYYNVGKGITMKASKPEVVTGKVSVREYVGHSGQVGQATPAKGRLNRQLNTLFFCPEIGCSSHFAKQSDFDEHMLSGKHEQMSSTSSMDRVKQSYVDRMKGSGIMKSTPLLQVSPNNQMSFDEANLASPSFQKLSMMGWALPIRSYFRFTSRQKALLYDIFIEGEESGKKSSAEEASLRIRKSLPVEEYVLPQQIKSLFSRWSKLYRENKLSIEAVQSLDAQSNYDSTKESNTETEEILNIAAEVVKDFDDPININDWVVVKFGTDWFPGIVLEVMLLLP